MGKIRVSDLAQRMGIPTQDLLFKLKSIGVRIEEEDPQIDTDVIQAILEGKKLPQPREVILRDGEAPPAGAAGRSLRRPMRRMPPNPLRPQRRRTLIQRVESRIKAIPVSGRPSGPAAVPPKPTEGTAPSEEVPVAADGASAAAPPAEAPVRDEATAKREKRSAKKPQPVEDEDLRTYRGSVKDLQVDETAGETERPTRRRRRARRREQAAESGGTLLPFAQQAPEGPVTVSEGMTVREFASKLGVRAKDLIKLLLARGVIATVNHILEPETAVQVAAELGIEAVQLSFEEEVQRRQEQAVKASSGTASRGPVVTIMGHVDHGKTTLLDAIRASKVTESEFGGITQHIGAYEVLVSGKKIVFLDTPGHEAFTMMRARGAKVTDLVVLVVAADDGVMPQTEEAIDHARAAGVPILVAINKMDKPDANPDRVKKELAERDLTTEDWGGETVAVPISAKNREGIDDLLEMILLTADLLELRSSPELPAKGVVLEARKEIGRGIVATVLVQDGTLHTGDVFVSGACWGRVRTLTTDLGQRVKDAEPATPVEVTGFSDVPEAGELFQVVEDESKARSIAEFRHQEQRRKVLGPGKGGLSLEQLYDRIEEGKVKELPIVLKADVQGSVEVLRDSLQKLSTEKVKVQIIHAGVGAITTNDVSLASASNAIVLGFNIRPERTAADLAEKEGVEIRLHTVIYELTDELQKAMAGLLEPVFQEVGEGRAEVRETFRVPRHGVVAGCHVVDGSVTRSARARLLRDNRVIWEGKIASLRRFKDDASEVRSGYDCGIRLEGFQDVKPGDVIEAFHLEEVTPTL